MLEKGIEEGEQRSYYFDCEKMLKVIECMHYIGYSNKPNQNRNRLVKSPRVSE